VVESRGGVRTIPDGTTTVGDADADNPAVGDAERQGDLRLTSPAFADGEPIPETYGRNAAKVNPPLSIRNVPGEAASLTLIVDDPDAVEPAGKVWLRWLVWNVPPSTTEIPEGWEPTTAVEGTNDFGEQARRRGGHAGPPPGSDAADRDLRALSVEPGAPGRPTERSRNDGPGRPPDGHRTTAATRQRQN
jgi:hypothetical protein